MSSVVLAARFPADAVIVLLPRLKPSARPFVLMLATSEALLLQARVVKASRSMIAVGPQPAM